MPHAPVLSSTHGTSTTGEHSCLRWQVGVPLICHVATSECFSSAAVVIRIQSHEYKASKGKGNSSRSDIYIIFNQPVTFPSIGHVAKSSTGIIQRTRHTRHTSYRQLEPLSHNSRPPSAHLFWAGRDSHHCSQTLKSDEAKWPKMTKMTLTSSFLRDVPKIWTKTDEAIVAIVAMAMTVENEKFGRHFYTWLVEGNELSAFRSWIQRLIYHATCSESNRQNEGISFFLWFKHISIKRNNALSMFSLSVFGIQIRVLDWNSNAQNKSHLHTSPGTHYSLVY